LNWILVAILAILAVAPLTYPGFFQAQSGFLPAFNVEHLSTAPNWGRLADPLRGEGKLPYLLVWPIFTLSGSGISAVKWGYGLAFVLGALGLYGYAYRWLGGRGGVLAAVVYTYLPWHLSTVYVRGTYAEAWLWTFWPIILWAVDRFSEHRPTAVLVAIMVGLPTLAATFWTQPGLAALFTPILVAYYATIAHRRQRWILRLAGMLALLFLTLWFVAQSAPEARLSFGDHVLYPFQLLSAAWADGLSFQLGLAAVGLSIVAVALLVGSGSKNRGASGDSTEPDGLPAHQSDPPAPLSRALWFWVIVLLVLVALALPPLVSLWEITGLDAFLAYPWQLLALVAVPLAFLSGSAVRLDERLATLPAWAGLVALVILASYPYLAPRFTQVDPGPEPVALLQPVGADVAQIMILDYEVAPPTEINPTLAITLTWQAVDRVADDYTVFVHVLSEGDRKAAQVDSRPCNGDCPTTSWQPGEIIVDPVQASLAPDAPPGPYRLAIGLYLVESGERAAVVGRDDETVFLDVP
jgi:hypothetical protein